MDQGIDPMMKLYAYVARCMARPAFQRAEKLAAG
jgi:glutathione S-transferase